MSALITLTASDRLARELRAQHSLAQRCAGLGAWETPKIQSLRQWVLDRWLETWPAQQLLHSVQELILWQQVIAEDSRRHNYNLLSTRGCAREAQRADRLIRMHALRPERASFPSADQEAFLRWRRRFQARCRDLGWVVSADLPFVVAEMISQGAISVAGEIALSGFAEPLTAGENTLLEALRRAGCAVRIPADPPRNTALHGWRTVAAPEQFRSIAEAIRAQLLSTPREAPPPRIIVAVSDPDAERELIEREFRGILAPWLKRPDSGRMVPWQWEQGRPLSEQPWVDSALAVLELSRRNPPAVASRVLLSSTLWSPGDRQHTAALDHHLRDRGWPQIRLSRLQPPEAARQLRERFSKLAKLIESEPEQALPSTWARHFRERLDALGWPGDTALGSAAFQIVTEFRRMLDRLATLDLQLQKTSRSSALAWLQELLRATRLEPRHEHEQPILILGHDDAVGLPCDVLFVADATADNLPGAAQPSPFIPLDIQRTAGLPESSPGTWLEHRRQQLAALLQAVEVHVYAPGAGVRGEELLPSPLLPPLEWKPAGIANAADTPPQIRLPDTDPVPAVADPVQELRHRDTRLFKAYAEAPFYAFIGWRLGANPLPQAGFGLNARAQGTVLHEALNLFWEKLRDRDNLLALADEQLEQEVLLALGAPFKRFVQTADYGTGLTTLEHARLSDLLRQWLQHERRRRDAFVVEIREAQVEANVSGLPLLLRVDRVDRVRTHGGDRWLVLDYKTGREAKTAGWKADSLGEPQLPLYASRALLDRAGISQVDGVCFAHLKDGHPAFVAWTNWREKLIEDDGEYFHDNWSDQLGAWGRRLDEIARGFLNGAAGLPEKRNPRSHFAHWQALADDFLEETDE